MDDPVVVPASPLSTVTRQLNQLSIQNINNQFSSHAKAKPSDSPLVAPRSTGKENDRPGALAKRNSTRTKRKSSVWSRATTEPSIEQPRRVSDNEAEPREKRNYNLPGKYRELATPHKSPKRRTTSTPNGSGSKARRDSGAFAVVQARRDSGSFGSRRDSGPFVTTPLGVAQRLSIGGSSDVGSDACDDDDDGPALFSPYKPPSQHRRLREGEPNAKRRPVSCLIGRPSAGVAQQSSRLGGSVIVTSSSSCMYSRHQQVVVDDDDDDDDGTTTASTTEDDDDDHDTALESLSHSACDFPLRRDVFGTKARSSSICVSGTSAGPTMYRNVSKSVSFSLPSTAGDVDESNDGDDECSTEFVRTEPTDELHQLRLPSRLERGMNAVSPQTVADLLSGKYSEHYDRVLVLDCRFAYEYDGGHVRGAKHVQTPDELNALLQRSPPREGGERIAVVFHCEFSSERGPRLYRALRSWDRGVHSDCYPQLYYPELYLLKGGYKRFFKEQPDFCEPRAYQPMWDSKFKCEMRDGLGTNRKASSSRRSRSMNDVASYQGLRRSLKW